MAQRLNNQRTHVFLWVFFLGYALGWGAWWARAAEFNPLFINGTQFLSVVSLAASVLLLFCHHGKFLFAFPSLKFKVIGLLFLSWFMLIVGVLNYVQNHDLSFSNVLGVLTGDLGALVYYVAPLSLAFLSPQQWRRFIGCISMVVGLVFLLTYKKMDFAQAASFADRSGVYQELGSLAGLHNGIAAAVIPLAAMGIALGKSRLTALFAVLVIPLVLMVALFYSKRQPLMELFMFIIYISIYASSKKASRAQRLYLKIGTIGCIVILIYYFHLGTLSTLIDRLAGRVSDVGETGIGRFDRIEEATQFFSRAHILGAVFGYGIGSTSEYLVANWLLHLGVANLIFKGGVPFCLFVIGALIFNVYVSTQKRMLNHRGLVVFLSLFVLIQLGYAPLWGFVPSVLTVGLGFLAPEIIRIQAFRSAGSASISCLSLNGHDARCVVR